MSAENKNSLPDIKTYVENRFAWPEENNLPSSNEVWEETIDSLRLHPQSFRGVHLANEYGMTFRKGIWSFTWDDLWADTPLRSDLHFFGDFWPHNFSENMALVYHSIYQPQALGRKDKKRLNRIDEAQRVRQIADEIPNHLRNLNVRLTLQELGNSDNSKTALVGSPVLAQNRSNKPLQRDNVLDRSSIMLIGINALILDTKEPYAPDYEKNIWAVNGTIW